MAGDSRRCQGMAQVISYEVRRILSEVHHDLIMASTGGPSARTIVHYSLSCPNLLGRSPPYQSQKERL